MKTLVLGAGVVGVTTAYFLAKAGHEVTILDERDGVGLEASAGNAGIIATGHAFAWASPGAPAHALGVAARRRDGHPRAARVGPAPVRVGAPLPARVHGGAVAAQHARQARALPVQPAGDGRAGRAPRASSTTPSPRAPSTSTATRASSTRASRRWRSSPSTASGRRCSIPPRSRGSTPSSSRSRGRSPVPSATSATRAATRGSSSEHLARALPGVARRHREARRARHRAAGGGRLDRRRAHERGRRSPPTTTCSRSASAAPSSRARSGSRCPSTRPRATRRRFPLRPGGLAPTLPGIDEARLVAWSRLGDRLRLTSTAEFAGYDWSWTPRNFDNILHLARDLFPDAADYAQGEYRACLRPMTPDGAPILGLARHRNLFLNCGHGHLGLDHGVRHRAHRRRPHDAAACRRSIWTGLTLSR